MKERDGAPSTVGKVAPPTPSSECLVPYLKAYARTFLPFAASVGAVYILRGGALSEVVGATVGAILLGGVVAFVVVRVAKPEPEEDEAAKAANRRANPLFEDADYEARIDEDLQKLERED